MDNNQTNNLDDILVIAITGGLSTGKSTVSEIISKNGYPIINTDNLAKKVVNQSKKIQEQIIKNFGTNPLNLYQSQVHLVFLSSSFYQFLKTQFLFLRS